MSIDGAVHATLWAAGRGHDLNTLLDANDPLRDQVLLVQALFINERGQIVACEVHRTDGTRVLNLLTPTSAEHWCSPSECAGAIATLLSAHRT